MKRRTTIYLSLICSVLLFLAAGCKKEEEDTSGSGNGTPSGGGAPTQNTLSATINGETVNFGSAFSASAIDVLGTTVFLSGSSADGRLMTFQLSGWDQSIGSWLISSTSTNPSANLSYVDSQSNAWVTPAFVNGGMTSAVSVNIGVSYFDGESIVGTFSGEFASSTSSDVISITNGTFTVAEFQ